MEFVYFCLRISVHRVAPVIAVALFEQKWITSRVKFTTKTFDLDLKTVKFICFSLINSVFIDMYQKN